MSSTIFTEPGNFRDLGGIPVTGGEVRSSRVFRSDDLSTATDEFLDSLLADHGITEVVDLRAAEETAKVNLGRLGSRGIDYHNVALGGQVMDGYAMPANDDDMAEFYVRLVEQHSRQMVSIFSLIAWSTGGLVFHCAAGKDRTGILAALLLRILGAEDEEIIKDYGVTAGNVRTMVARWLAATPAASSMASDSVAGEAADADSPRVPPREFLESLDMDNLPPLMDARPTVLRLALVKLDAKYGDALEPLRAAGLDENLVSRLRSQLVVG
ncbi:hypothetical protein GU243_00315 [Pseudarthrobacter psychrotolerans]|uniref:Tyrosine specific protein phosphatases domain-containing protein n=1 Tax=Pseudarthrobacter psychrotolerans TaxID=2697569 RepID=A0A6P1NG64_9MICC|nr:tyrosine-protein phosphatase [Pseudarthrobacter psychrotolerans]QHK18489.1 hypothetical protein GU243_00315 [Pseudarthrobacter psychrotolerans]